MLIRILLLVILFILLARTVRGILAGAMTSQEGPRKRGRGEVPGRGVQMVRDPVCGTFLPPASALAVTEHDGRVLHFCSEACKKSYALKKRA